jgi:hypothetical protein
MDNQFVFKHVKAHQNPNASSHTIADSLAKMGARRE